MEELKNENAFVTKMEGNKYLMITNKEDLANKAQNTFKDTKTYNIIDENGETINKLMEFTSVAKNAYYVRQALGVATKNINSPKPKDELDRIAKEMHVQRNTAIAIALGEASALSTLKVKKVLGENFDETINRVKEFIHK